MTPDSEEHGGSCLHTNTMNSRNISRTLICLDCGKRDPFNSEVCPHGRKPGVVCPECDPQPIIGAGRDD